MMGAILTKFGLAPATHRTGCFGGTTWLTGVLRSADLGRCNLRCRLARAARAHGLEGHGRRLEGRFLVRSLVTAGLPLAAIEGEQRHDRENSVCYGDDGGDGGEAEGGHLLLARQVPHVPPIVEAAGRHHRAMDGEDLEDL